MHTAKARLGDSELDSKRRERGPKAAERGGIRVRKVACWAWKLLPVLANGYARCWRRLLRSRSTHFTCFTSTKVQILTLEGEELVARQCTDARLDTVWQGTQFTCFTGTKVQILTLRAVARCACERVEYIEGIHIYIYICVRESIDEIAQAFVRYSVYLLY